MSKAFGDKVLSAIVTEVLERSDIWARLSTNYRKELNKRFHVLDLSYAALKSANLRDGDEAVFRKSYNEFIDTLKDSMTTYYSLEAFGGDLRPKLPSTTFMVLQPRMLISPSFEAARTNITKISKKIPNNVYFGISNRVRKLDELLGEGYTLAELNRDGRYFDPNTGDELLYEGGPLRTRELSLVDLGHTPAKEAGRISPLSEQLQRAIGGTVSKEALISGITAGAKTQNADFPTDLGKLNFDKTNENLASYVEKAFAKLRKIQAKATVSFKNEIPEKLGQISGAKGFLSLTLQLYNVNNDISKQESKIRNDLISRIKSEIEKNLLKIPGSNTLEQDLLEYVQKTVAKAISGDRNPIKLGRHDRLGTTKTSTTAPVVAKTTKTQVSISKGKGKALGIRNLRGQFYSLASLQRLLDANLTQKIKENMGNGSRRDILNLRSGRFAESAKVERLSQSREGMITAFYTYMKNPYQTFEPGYRQGSPTSRNPRLLISKSIRDIAATQVANRMRAVLI